MSDMQATVVIKGRNELSMAVRRAEQDLKGLLKTGELLKKTLAGGALVGAIVAFERLAENAEKAAEKIGDKGTAGALRKLNKEIDALKSKGLNIIGRVLGDSYIAVAGTELERLEVKVRNLRGTLQSLREQYSATGGGFFEFQRANARAAIFATEGQLGDAESRLRFLQQNRPFGERDRAPGSRGGGRAVQATPPTGGGGGSGRADPFAGLSEINVWQREIFSLGNAQRDALAKLSEETNREVSADLQQLTNETTKMLGTMTEQWKVATDTWTVYADQAARNLQDSFAQFLFDPFAEGIDGMLKGFVDVLRRMLAEYVAFQAFSAIGGALAGSSNAFVAGIGGFLKGARAGGGPVTGGSAYLVGERGPEMFVPSSSGNIVPNGAFGGVTVNYTIDARGGDAERLMAALPGILKRSQDQTVATVMDLSRRGRLA